MAHLTTPTAKKRTFSELDPTNESYLPSHKKFKANESYLPSLGSFKSQEANDIIRFIQNINSPLSSRDIGTLRDEIKKKGKQIDEEIEMFRSLSIDDKELRPRYDAKSELVVIEYQLDSIQTVSGSETYSTAASAPIAPVSLLSSDHSDPMQLDMSSSNEERSDDMDSFMDNTIDSDFMLSQLISMGFDHASATDATQRFSSVDDECIAYLLDHQDVEQEIAHSQQLEEKADAIDDELESIVHEIQMQDNNHNNSVIDTQSTDSKPSTKLNTNQPEPRPHLICFTCSAKWRLQNIEFYAKYKVCDQCPDNIRALCSPADGWCCPLCQHHAHVLFRDLSLQSNESIAPQANPFNNNNIGLHVIHKLNTNQDLYLQIKQSNKEQLDIYKVHNVDDNEQLLVLPCDKKGQISSKELQSLSLKDIDRERIIWSHCPQKRSTNMICSSYVRKICSVNEDKTITIHKKKHYEKNVEKMTVQLSQIIHSQKWLDYQLRKRRKTLKRQGIKLNTCSLFTYSNALHKSVKEVKERNHQKPIKRRRKQVESVEVVETAPLNERHFNDKHNKRVENKSIQPKKIRWSCGICTFDNVSIAQNPVQCEMCNQSQEISIDIDDNEKVMQTGYILCELRAKLGMDPNKNKQQSAPKGTFAGDMGQIYRAIQNPIVAIVGASGSGKSTLLRSICNDFDDIYNDPPLEWNNRLGIISQFGAQNTDDVISLLSSIGLNSVPSWLKPFHILSNGEQYRASFARLLHLGLQNKNQWLMKDEFTSCLDRANARVIAASISKYIRQNQDREMAKFIVATSKVDIIRYLQPDIVISVAGNNRYKIMQNENDLRDKTTYAPDVKVILDLPKFAEVRKSIKSLYEYCVNNIGTKEDISCTLSIEKKVSRLQCQIEMDQHTDAVGRCFDIPFEGKITTDVPYLEAEHIFAHRTEFAIGCVYGPSGSGKTTTGERLFGRIVHHEWDQNQTVCEHFLSLDDMEEKFNAVSLSLALGLSKYQHLSQGEQDRVNIAIRLGQNDVLIDEFTSNLDRATAKRLALGVRDYIRRNHNEGIVILTCHADFIRELQPNWLFDIENKKVYHFNPVLDIDPQPVVEDDYEARHEYIDSQDMWNKAVIRLRLTPTKYSDFSPKFSKYHYMTHSIACSALCFSVWATFDGGEAEIVGFISVMQNPFVDNMNSDMKFHYREHRTVILPAYQGLGFGSRICDAVAYWLSLHDKRLQSKTAHPRYGRYRDHSPLWMPLNTNHSKQKRNSWTTQRDRKRGIKQEESTEKEKIFYSHVFKLKYQRTQEEETYLNQRVIVNDKNVE